MARTKQSPQRSINQRRPQYRHESDLGICLTVKGIETRNGTPVNRTYVSTVIRNLCAEAQVPDRKGNQQCLKRLYQSTRDVIEYNVALLMD